MKSARPAPVKPRGQVVAVSSRATCTCVGGGGNMARLKLKVLTEAGLIAAWSGKSEKSATAPNNGDK